MLTTDREGLPSAIRGSPCISAPAPRAYPVSSDGKLIDLCDDGSQMISDSYEGMKDHVIPDLCHGSGGFRLELLMQCLRGVAFNSHLSKVH